MLAKITVVIIIYVAWIIIVIDGTHSYYYATPLLPSSSTLRTGILRDAGRR